MKKNIIKTIFEEIIVSSILDESLVKRYFHKDYIQYVDGKTLNLEELINHLHNQKKHVKNIKIDFISLCEENNIIFSNHIIKAISNNNEEIIIKIIAEFTFNDNNQIIACDELTYLLSGNKEYKDLGSN